MAGSAAATSARPARIGDGLKAELAAARSPQGRAISDGSSSRRRSQAPWRPPDRNPMGARCGNRIAERLKRLVRGGRQWQGEFNAWTASCEPYHTRRRRAPGHRNACCWQQRGGAGSTATARPARGENGWASLSRAGQGIPDRGHPRFSRRVMEIGRRRHYRGQPLQGPWRDAQHGAAMETTSTPTRARPVQVRVQPRRFRRGNLSTMIGRPSSSRTPRFTKPSPPALANLDV